MAEVEHVADPHAVRCAHRILDALRDEVLRPEEAPGVDVALVRKVGAAAADRVGEVDAAVYRQAVGLAGGHALEQSAGAGDVEDDGDVGVRLPEVGYDARRVRRRKRVKVLWGQVRRPRVKDLDDLHAAAGDVPGRTPRMWVE